MAVLPAVEAKAADADSEWSVAAPTTDAPGSNVLSLEMGFPGFTLGWEHGISNNFDLGVKLDLDYGVFYSTATQFGIGVRVPLRFRVARVDAMTVTIHLDPGFEGYVPSNEIVPNGQFGIRLTPGAELGFQIIPKLRAGVALDIPMAIQVINVASFVISPQVGGFIEGLVAPRVVLGLNVRFGPDIVTAGELGSGVGFGFLTQAVFGYRF
jgi:hypothetical protein